MADKVWIQDTVERIVTAVMETHVPHLKDELVRRAVEEIQPAVGNGSGGGSTRILKAVSVIQGGTGQREILRALLDQAADFCGRAALFIVKAGRLQGWQGRGFSDSEAIRDFELNPENSVLSRVMEGKKPVSSGGLEFDQNFLGRFTAPVDERCLVLPLVLKDKVAAIVYADAGTDEGDCDEAALQLIVNSTSHWLEILSFRKSGAAAVSEPGKPADASTSATGVSAAVAEPSASAEYAPVPVEAATEAFAAAAPEVAFAAAAAAESGRAPQPVSAPASMTSTQDADVHRKAERFARLLIDEIKLYNLAKVDEGRKKRDLFDRLKPDIEKSRATYQKRYGQTAAASGDYFHRELVRSLAQDDASLLGANYRH